MNEATNFCKGTCYDSEKSAMPVSDKLEYIPTGRSLEDGSPSLDAVHHGGHIELDARATYATMMTRATHNWFVKENKRSFLLSRSMYAGHGKYGSRWATDNWSTGKSMGHSVTGSIQHSIAGVPLFGADVCGSNLDTTPELCARWYGLASFYTWSRNHKNIDYASQEPYLFNGIVYEGTVTYLEIIKRAMWTKFIFVAHMYSSLLDLHTKGGAFHKPLFFEFDTDAAAYTADAELNFMLGDKIKIAINSKYLDQNMTSFYFPKGTWCNVLKSSGTSTCMASTGQEVELPTKAYDVYAHLRENSIVALQDGRTVVETDLKTTTQDLKDYPVQLHINPLCDGPSCTATGNFNVDNGKDLDNTDRINRRKLDLVSTSPKELYINVTMTSWVGWTDPQFNLGRVNKNDRVEVIRIYNAKALGFDSGVYRVF